MSALRSAALPVALVALVVRTGMQCVNEILSTASGFQLVVGAHSSRLAAEMKTTAHTVTLSPTLRRLMVELQTWCSPDCCKARAFSISAEAVGRWLDGERIDRTPELAEEIAIIEAGLRQIEGPIDLAARDLGSTWNGAEFKAFWQAFAEAFRSAFAASSVAVTEPDGASDRPGV